MSRLLLATAVLAVLIYTMVLGVHWLTPRIEKDIAERVTTSMAEKGMLWADVSVHGRVVTVQGVAPDAATKQKALGTVASVFGVAQVQDKLLVEGEPAAALAKAQAPKRIEEQAAEAIAKEIAATYNLIITKNGDDIVLTGNVPDESSKDMLVRLAVTHYNGASHVNTDGLKIVPGAPAGWRTAVGAVLMHVVNLEQAKITISGTEVMVSGTVLSRQFSDQMEKAVKQVLPTKYRVAFAVDVVTPTTPVAPAAKVAEAPAATAPAKVEVKPEAKAEAKPEVKAEVKAEPKAEVKAEVKAPAKAEPKAEAKVAAAVSTTEAPKAEEKSFFARAKEAVAAKMAAMEPAAGAPKAAEAAAEAPVATKEACADMKSLKKERLNFAFDKAELTEAHTATLKKVAKTVTSCEHGQVVVAGYTDITGSHLYNRWLSQQRAEAGMRGLLREGVAKDNVHAVGYGELHPVASNATRAGRAANRRTTFTPGDKLPFPLPGVHEGLKHGKHVKIKAAKATVEAIATEPTPAEEAKAEVKKAEVKKVETKAAAKDVSATSIRKPWWARVESPKAVSPSGEPLDNVHKAVDHMLQPQPVTTVKQPPLTPKDKPWLGDQN